MDSRLDSIFKTTLQPMEKTDTRQAIRREEPHNDQQRKHDRNRKQQNDMPDDNTTLSVEALHGFLRMLLSQSGEPSGTEKSSGSHHPAPLHQSGNEAAARAASAYEHTARAAPGSHIDLDETASSPPTPGHPPIILSTEERRVIHQLLKDIETLANRGIDTINLYPDSRFLDSLAAGIREAMAAHAL